MAKVVLMKDQGKKHAPNPRVATLFCCFLHPLNWPLMFFVAFLCLLQGASVIMAHKMSWCMLSPLALIYPFHHKLEPVTSLLCVCVVFWFICFLFWVFVFCVFGLFLVFFCSLCFVWFSWWSWQCTGLCSGPPPVYFCGHSTGTAFAWLN